MGHMIKQIDNSQLPENAVSIVAFNPTQYERTEVVNAIIDVPEEANARWLTMEDTDGNELPVQFVQNYEFGPMLKSAYEFPIPYKARRFECSFEARTVPGVGYKTFVVKPQQGQKINVGSLSPKTNVLENAYLRAEIQPDGRIDLTNKETGQTYPGQHYFEDRSDVGDHATQRPADLDEIINSIGAPAQISIVMDGPLMVQYKVIVTMMLPKDAYDDGTQRNPERVPYEITSFITLRKDARFLEIKTELDNHVRDHKFRAMFPSGYADAEKSYSETHFDVTERDIQLPDTSTWKEPMLPYYPQYMFCGVEGKKNGLALLNVGLPEYAVHDDEDRTIGLTLLRTYRFPIIGANPETVQTDHSQVMCQCLRKFTFEYALYPYAGSWDKGQVVQQANRFNIKMRLNQVGRSSGTLPSTLGLIKIEPEELVLSAVKKSDRNNSLIVRVFNPTEKTVSGSVTFWKSIQKANLVKLDESVEKAADISGNAVKISATANKIVTIEVFFE